MERFEADIAAQLDLLAPMVRDFSPHGCRDELDWLCQDAHRCVVVVELKLGGGDKRGVEQVLRYMRQIRADSRYEGREVRGIFLKVSHTSDKEPRLEAICNRRLHHHRSGARHHC